MAATSRERGQATVELALAIPMLMLAAVLIVQIGVVVRNRVALSHVAREAARVAVVDPSLGAVRDAAMRAAHLDGQRLRVDLTGDTSSGGFATVTVTYTDPTDVVLIGALLPDVTLTERLVVRVE